MRICIGSLCIVSLLPSTAAVTRSQTLLQGGFNALNPRFATDNLAGGV